MGIPEGVSSEVVTEVDTIIKDQTITPVIFYGEGEAGDGSIELLTTTARTTTHTERNRDESTHHESGLHGSTHHECYEPGMPQFIV